MRTEIENIIRQKAAQFYPELAGRDVKINVLAPVSKLHKSVIYEVRVSSDLGISRDIIVKHRVYNANYRNDVVEGTQREFRNLQRLEKQGEGKFRVVKGLGVVEEKGLLFMEKVPGEKLSEVLKGFTKKRPSRERLTEVKGHFYHIGQCLKVFHDSSATGRTDRIPVDENIRKTGEMISTLGWPGRWARLEAARRQMEALKSEAGIIDIPVVFKHGDFQPRNILLQDGVPVIFDVGGCRPAIAFHDISDFLVGLFNFNLLFPFSKFSFSTQTECATAFLDGYFSDQRKTRAARKFLLMVCAIQQFESVIQRVRSSFARTVWAAWYYRKLFARLAAWNIKG